MNFALNFRSWIQTENNAVKLCHVRLRGRAREITGHLCVIVAAKTLT
jgi:hypothetical protein